MVSYTGDVTPGGPPQTRKAGCVTITKVAVDPDMSNNAYLLHCEETDELVLIDAAADAPTLLALVGDRPLAAVVTTHQHWDHHRALAEVVAATGAQVIAGAPDAAEVTAQTGVAVDRTVTDGDRVAAGTCDLTVIALAGHTPGSIALFWEDDTGQGHLFTGDSLFPGGVGNTFGDSAAFESLINDVSTKIFDVYGDDVWFYPGHGSDSTLGAERPHLAEWRERGW
ncbi:MBL fold metallo-hydrolase [Nocardioides sp.]|uniref:MBL fold metallo-hydrolase n=1 Tax=Nocardioides sp. TaxID=35761 RepID=UPI002C9702DB|nr:MBL fold metallo-hydrolase [Nocardioides sp.]HXH78568.1 MBL fold metallo-hydrolase [Nocardioides sp.]